MVKSKEGRKGNSERKNENITKFIESDIFQSYKEKLITEARKGYVEDVEKIIDEVYKDLDMGKTIPIFIQRLKEKLNKERKD